MKTLLKLIEAGMKMLMWCIGCVLLLVVLAVCFWEQLLWCYIKYDEWQFMKECAAEGDSVEECVQAYVEYVENL